VALLGLGLATACCVVAGMALGWFLDRQLGTAPVFILLGLASGIVLGVFGTIIEVRRHLNG
jgi:F0F1-type ATP synthase assembly protein I